MKILIIGNGAREHALAWKAAQSPQVHQVWVAPGNAGTALESKVMNVAIAADDIDGLLKFAEENKIALTIVGPEVPLSLGIVDKFYHAGLRCFGPTQHAAQLEASKSFCKDFLRQHNIPTARYESFTEIAPAIEYLKQHTLPVVIKADGLAAGKGVVIATSAKEAQDTITEMLSGKGFGAAGQRIVIEEFLDGEELSYIIITDGQHILPLASSQDHKRRDDGDKGPNTGGMGAYSPSPLLTPELEQKVLDTVMIPTVQAMAAAGTPYVGFLYAGLMITNSGPKVLEFNCRLGDPETQPILMRLQSDLVGLCMAAFEGQLNCMHAEWDPRPALGVVMAAGGYPFDYKKGAVITGLDQPLARDCKIFHAATRQEGDTVVTNGGRVLTVTALGDDVAQAQQNAYAVVKKIQWDGCFYRKDIGWRAL